MGLGVEGRRRPVLTVSLRSSVRVRAKGKVSRKRDAKDRMEFEVSVAGRETMGLVLEPA